MKSPVLFALHYLDQAMAGSHHEKSRKKIVIAISLSNKAFEQGFQTALANRADDNREAPMQGLVLNAIYQDDDSPE